MNQCHISGVVVAVCLCVLLQTASASLYYTGYSPALYGWNQPSTDFFGNFSGGSLVMPIFRKSFVSFSQINSMIVSFFISGNSDTFSLQLSRCSVCYLPKLFLLKLTGISMILQWCWFYCMWPKMSWRADGWDNLTCGEETRNLQNTRLFPVLVYEYWIILLYLMWSSFNPCASFSGTLIRHPTCLEEKLCP